VAVQAGPSVAVAGCKQVEWQDGAQLIDVGSPSRRWAAG